MVAYQCPNCGQQLPISWQLPRTITCKNCHTKSIIPYEQDPDYDDYSSVAKLKVKINGFRTNHPNVVKGMEVAGIAVALIVIHLFTKDDGMNASSSVESSDQLSEEQNHPLSTASNIDTADSSSAEFLSESEESAPTHREYSPHNPDKYDTIMKRLDMTMVHLPEGWHPSQKKVDEYKEQTGDSLPDGMTFRSPHDHPYQVKKD